MFRKVIEKSLAPVESLLKEKRIPNTRSELNNYYFICDICGREYGPKSSVRPIHKIDGGVELLKSYYMSCPECGRFVCKNQCWNYEKGTCTLCTALTLPEYVVKQEKLKTNYYLVCSICRKQIGPISYVNWDKVKKISTGSAKIALASAGYGSGFLIGSGAADMARAATTDGSQKRGAKEVAAEAKLSLAKCPSCSKWVCIEDCWDKDKGLCKVCYLERQEPSKQLEHG